MFQFKVIIGIYILIAILLIVFKGFLFLPFVLLFYDFLVLCGFFFCVYLL